MKEVEICSKLDCSKGERLEQFSQGFFILLRIISAST